MVSIKCILNTDLTNLKTYIHLSKLFWVNLFSTEFSSSVSGLNTTNLLLFDQRKRTKIFFTRLTLSVEMIRISFWTEHWRSEESPTKKARTEWRTSWIGVLRERCFAAAQHVLEISHIRSRWQQCHSDDRREEESLTQTHVILKGFALKNLLPRKYEQNEKFLR